MSPLASRIYKHLVTRVHRNQPSLTYGELAAAVDVHHRSQKLHAAHTDDARISAWEREHAKVLGAADRYPAKLDG